MQRARAPIAATLLLALAACSDQRDPSGPGAGEPAAIIFDGSRNDEADDFFFLPPIMPDPSTHDNFDDGKFNTGLRPTVSICQLAADPNASPMTDCVLLDGAPILIADFASSAVSMSTTNEHYQVNWHTDESSVLVDKFYRIQVFVGSTRVGFADLDPVSSARELKSTQTNEVIPLVDGRTLPIKFRIEHGVLCENELDCGEFTVTNAGGTFLTNTKHAGVQFGPNFLPPGVDQITLTIERVTVGVDNQCHAASNSRLWKQWEACYSFTTDPDLKPLGGIQAPATVGKCTELSTEDPLYDKQLGYKSHDGENLVALPNVTLPVNFGLDCEGFFGTGVITQSSNPLIRLAQAGWRGLGTQVGRVFGVRPAYAIDLGLGDRVRVGDGFSQINWGIGLDGSVASNGEQSVGFGLAAAPLELLMEYSHVHAHQTDGEEGGEEYEAHVERMGGVPVTFEVTTGNGYFALDVSGNPIRETTVMTSAAELNLGIASVAFTADPNGLANVVTATAPTLDGQPFLFNVTGLPSDLVVEGLARSVASPTSGQALNWTFTVRNTGQGRSIASSVRLIVSRTSPTSDGPAAVRDVAVPSLAPGAAEVIEAVEAVGPLTAGTYSVSVIADQPSVVVEGSETNNTATETFTVRDPADLSLAIVEVQPTAPTTADATRFIIAVTNVGSAPTPATTAVLDLGADVADQIYNVPALDPGATATLIGPLVTIPATGEYIARGTLDPTDAIPETNETNNAATFGYFVSPPPDLQVTSITLSDAFPHQPGSVVQYIITVANTGPGRSRPGVARYTIGPAAPDLVFMPAVDPEQSVAVVVAGTVPATSYTVSVDADATEVIGEVDETNNSFATTIVVLGSITGVVTGNPAQLRVAGATISLANQAGTTIATTTSQENGAFGFDGLTPGVYLYSIVASGFQQATGQVTVLSGQSVQPIINLTPIVTAGSIAGQVLDGLTGAGLSDVTINMVSPGGTSVGPFDVQGGAFDVPNLPPGPYTYVATKTGYTSSTGTINVPTGGIVQPIIELTALVTVSGVVTDVVTGQPIVGASVSLAGSQLATVTNALGQYIFPSVRAGSGSTITASFGGYQPSTQGISIGNFPVAINFRLVPSTPLITVEGNAALTYFQNGTVAAGFTITNGAGGTLQGLGAGPLQQCTDLNCSSAGTSPWLLASFTPGSGFGTITLGNGIPLSQIAVGTYYFYIDVSSSNASNSPYRHRFAITITAPVTLPGGDGGVGTVVPPSPLHD